MNNRLTSFLNYKSILFITVNGIINIKVFCLFLMNQTLLFCSELTKLVADMQEEIDELKENIRRLKRKAKALEGRKDAVAQDDGERHNDFTKADLEKAIATSEDEFSAAYKLLNMLFTEDEILTHSVRMADNNTSPILSY